VRIFFNKITLAATASENNMSNTSQSTQAAQGQHPALVRYMPGLHLVIGTADITVHNHPDSITQIKL
jgi:hypothetical protein